MEIKVGADPEVFVKQNGVFLSAHGLIKGDKDNPFPVDRGAVQVDGMALEFNINPAGTEDDFILNIQSVMDTLRGMVPDYEVVATPVAFFDENYMKEQPAEALELGCEPDFNGWTLGQNDRPVAKEPIRTASGHIHVGWGEGMDTRDPSHFSQCAGVAQQLDFFLGLPSLFYDEDTKRRSLYGCGGAFRPKTYGMEYRVLSNVWLTSENLMRWAYRNTLLGMKNLMEGTILSAKYGDIQDIINNSNKKAAKEIILDANIPLPEA